MSDFDLATGITWTVIAVLFIVVAGVIAFAAEQLEGGVEL
jgi:hypothetical protein